MSGIFGILGLDDTDRTFVNVIGQEVVYDAIGTLLERYNIELNAAMAIFIQMETDSFKERYKLPGGGRLQRIGPDGNPGAVKRTGQYDVAYPLEEFGAATGGNRVALAYMTVKELDTHLDTIFTQGVNTLRFELLKALFNNNQDTFIDELHGSLSIEPLANGDAVLYPPVLGSETEATEDHYLESNFLATAISDTNNPYLTIKDEIEEHFGSAQGGSNILVMINNAETPETEDLSDYDPVNDRFTTPGADVDQLFGFSVNIPGKLLGRTNGVWVSEWRWIPANYMLAVDLDIAPPLKIRQDPDDTGLPTGLSLVAEDERFPLQYSYYTHRFGLGSGNRLNGVSMELGTGGTYTIPTDYL
jgi:hypothetical protein